MKIQVNKQNVGLRIKQIRLNKGYTLEEFGKLFNNASKGNIQYWENGKSLPNKERIKAIAKLGDMTVNELLYGSVEEFVRENYYEIDLIYKNTPSTEIEILKYILDDDKKRIISYVCDEAKEKNITVNDVDRLLKIANDIINVPSRAYDNLYNYLMILLKKLEDEDLLNIYTLLHKTLYEQEYYLDDKDEKMLESIGLYLSEHFISDELLNDK